MPNEMTVRDVYGDRDSTGRKAARRGEVRTRTCGKPAGYLVVPPDINKPAGFAFIPDVR